LQFYQSIEIKALQICYSLTALSNLDRTKNITVSTFREGDTKGIAPRALYKKFGFVEGELIEEFGYSNQRFILYP